MIRSSATRVVLLVGLIVCVSVVTMSCKRRAKRALAVRSQRCAQSLLPKLGPNDFVATLMIKSSRKGGTQAVLARFNHDASASTYRLAKQRKLDMDFAHVRASRCGLLVSDARVTLRIGADFKVLGKRTYNRPCAVSGSDRFGYIYSSAGGVFRVLDQRLKTLGSVKLTCKGKQKNAHAIAIHGEHAYLLDNRYAPRCILRVRITHPSKPVIVTNVSGFGGTYAHLGWQWLFPKQDLWLFSSSGGGDGGRWEKLIGVNMTMKSGTRVFEKTIYHARASRTPADVQLADINAEPPGWVVIQPQSNQLELARLSVTRTGVTFGRRQVIYKGPMRVSGALSGVPQYPQGVRMWRRGKRLFIVLPNRQLVIADPTTSPATLTIIKLPLPSTSVIDRVAKY